jgi:hypothetical protein
MHQGQTRRGLDDLGKSIGKPEIQLHSRWPTHAHPAVTGAVAVGQLVCGLIDVWWGQSRRQ